MIVHPGRFGRRTSIRPGRKKTMGCSHWWKRGLWLTLLGALLTGCSGWMGPPAEIRYDSQATRLLMNQLMATNAGLEAIKGVGRVTVSERRSTGVIVIRARRYCPGVAAVKGKSLQPRASGGGGGASALRVPTEVPHAEQRYS